MITHATLTPTALAATPLPATSSLRSLIVAGEAATTATVAPWAGKCAVLNGYGPTEASVCATMSSALMPGEDPPIGKPLAHVRVHILDEWLRPCPVGVIGDLYIAGGGLARGYLAEPAMTAARFIANRFGDLGTRLYRTGDRAAWRSDGQLAFHGRGDNQLKIRGYRVEPGEIEAAIVAQPEIAQAAVILTQGVSTPQLTAYVTPDFANDATKKILKQLEGEHVQLWSELEDGFGGQPAEHSDPAFNIRGWNSSYTGLPLTQSEMRAYVDETVARICSLEPHRVIEIGCGAGLILFQLLPHLDFYDGLDPSAKNIRNLIRLQNDAAIRVAHPGLKRASLHCAPAEELERLALGPADTIVLASVIQYFPGEAYLSRTLDRLIANHLSAGGTVFIADVRSLPLLPAFHASVQAFRAGCPPLEKSTGPAQDAARQEIELALDPAFFQALKQRHPRITSVQVVPKRGACAPEMRDFRYDVFIRTGSASVCDSSFAFVATPRSIEEVASALATRPDTLAYRAVPNGRFTEAGIEPDALWALAEAQDYQLDMALLPGHAHGAFDLLFRRRSEGPLPPIDWTTHAVTSAPLSNRPLEAKFHLELAGVLRARLEMLLPDYMVPGVWHVLDALPRTAHGKLDRRSLPAPARPHASSRYVASITHTERVLCTAVEQILGLDRASPTDHFFHSGGDSISSIRLVNRARECGVFITPRDVFLYPVIGALAQIARNSNSGVDFPLQSDGAVEATPIMRWLLTGAGSWRGFCQAMLVQLPPDFDGEAFLSALQALLNHHDALRMRVLDDGRASILPEGAIRARDCFSCEAGLPKYAHATAERFDPAAGRLVHAILFDPPAGAQRRLLLAIHHLAVDAVSWPILLSDLATAYAAARMLRPIRLPAKTASFRAWGAYLRESVPARRRELALWREHSSAPVSRLFGGLLDAKRDTAGSAAHFEISLHSATTQTLLTRVPAAFHATINHVFVTALALAMARNQQQKQTNRVQNRPRRPWPRDARRAARPVAHCRLVHNRPPTSD